MLGAPSSVASEPAAGCPGAAEKRTSVCPLIKRPRNKPRLSSSAASTTIVFMRRSWPGFSISHVTRLPGAADRSGGSSDCGTGSERVAPLPALTSTIARPSK